MAMKRSFVIAGVLTLGLAGWLLSGQIGGGNAEDAGAAGGARSLADGTAPGSEALVTVRVQDLSAETIEREIVINGKTEPVRSVELRAETNGRVIEVAGSEGSFVDQGQALVELDLRDREVLKLEAEAVRRQRQIDLDAARKLGEKGFQAETSVATAEADFAAAEAALRRAELELDHTVIRAPFAGILDRRHVEIGDYLDIGDPVAVLLDPDPYLVTGDVTETQVGKLEPGMTGRVRLANGDRAEGRVRYVASRADEQTRTFEIELEVQNPSGRLAAGVSAEIRLSVERVAAHRTSPSVLALADDGTLGVKTVDDRDKVVFRPVDIARTDGNQVWLTGLPEQVRLITVGQGFVSDGTKVRPVPVDAQAVPDGSEQVISEAAR